MKTIYVDAEYKCHSTPVEGAQAFETDLFDKINNVEEYMYIPEGESWTAYNGKVFPGEDIVPIDRDALDILLAERDLNIATLRVSGANVDIMNKRDYASGEVGATITVEFDDHWSNLDICATFMAGDLAISQPVNGKVVVIPARILEKAHIFFEVGFCGYRKPGNKKILTSQVINFGRIPKGVRCNGESPEDPRHTDFEKLVDNVGDLSKLKTQCKDNLVCAINEIHDNHGASSNRVFDTEVEMREWLKTHSGELNIGDNLYIRETDVPDYWWDGTQVQVLETGKINLAEYYTKNETNELLDKIMKAISWGE